MIWQDMKEYVVNTNEMNSYNTDGYTIDFKNK